MIIIVLLHGLIGQLHWLSGLGHLSLAVFSDGRCSTFSLNITQAHMRAKLYLLVVRCHLFENSQF